MPFQAIGLLGGSFDPVHRGHLGLAHAAQASIGLEQMLFIPAAQPWQKSVATPAPVRLQMLELALQDHPHWQADPCEVTRTGPTYTFDTLTHLRARFGADVSLVWILGSDQIHSLSSWHRWQELLQLCHFAWAQRPGAQPTADAALRAELEQRQAVPAQLRSCPAGRIAAFPMPPIDCSSTQIRQAIGDGRLDDVTGLLPTSVAEYLRTHTAYRH